MANCEIQVRVIPRAKSEEVVGERHGAVCIKVTAAPVKGAANKKLLAFVARKLRLPKSAICIAAGETSREKRLRIEGMDTTEVRRRLLP